MNRSVMLQDLRTPGDLREHAPWIDGAVDEGYRFISAGEGNHLLSGFHLSGFINPADAAFMVKAWNAHDELVATLRAVEEALKPECNDDGTEQAIPDRCRTALDAARAALAKVDA